MSACAKAHREWPNCKGGALPPATALVTLADPPAPLVEGLFSKWRATSAELGDRYMYVHIEISPAAPGVEYIATNYHIVFRVDTLSRDNRA